MGSQISTREPKMLNTQGFSFRGRHAHSLIAQKAGRRGGDRLVICVLSVWSETTLDPPTDLYHKLVILGESIEPIFMEGGTCPLQRVFIPPGDLYLLYYACRFEFIITRNLCIKLFCGVDSNWS